MFEVFADVLLPIVIIVALGYVFYRASAPDIQPLNRVSLYLLSPALIFSSLVEADIAGGEGLRVVGFMLILTAAMFILSGVLGLTLRLSRESTAAMMLCTMFSNAGNYGLPVAFFAFGQQGFERAVLFFVTQGVLAQILGLYIAGSGHSDYKDGLKRLVQLPQIYAVAAALLARWAGPELFTSSQSVANDLFRGVSLLGDAAIPVLLVVLGMQLAQTRIDRADGVEISLAVGLRLLASIPISYGIAVLLGLDPLSTRLAVILGSMPTAVNVIILAIEFDIRPKLVSSIVIVSTALSLVTLTALLSVSGAG